MLYHLLYYLLEGRPYGYQNPLFRAVLAIMVAFITVYLLGPRTIRYLIHKKLGDIPDFDHKGLNEITKHKANVPTMGGILILIGITVAVLLLANLKTYYVYLGFFTMIYLGAIGWWDDRLKLLQKGRDKSRDGLKFYQKLLFQIALAIVLGYFVYKRGADNLNTPESTQYPFLTLPFFKNPIILSLPIFWLITILVVTGTSNAVNLTDGVDGLASGCVAMCCFAFMLLAYAVGSAETAAYLFLKPSIPESGELAIFCGAMMGACLGFLWYNCHPAQVFMGDTGSLPLGGLIGFVAIVLRQELLLLLVGGVFVMEAVSVMLQVGYFKLTGGKRIFLVAPIHHHFQVKGWTETQVVTRFWLLAALCAAMALATTKLR